MVLQVGSRKFEDAILAVGVPLFTTTRKPGKDSCIERSECFVLAEAGSRETVCQSVAGFSSLGHFLDAEDVLQLSNLTAIFVHDHEDLVSVVSRRLDFASLVVHPFVDLDPFEAGHVLGMLPDLAVDLFHTGACFLKFLEKLSQEGHLLFGFASAVRLHHPIPVSSMGANLNRGSGLL